MSTRENRTYVASEVRAAGGGSEPLSIEGYAAVFNSYSQDLGGFKERIKPGAFDRTISEKQDVRCLFNHDPNVVLGRTISGTLLLAQDAKGLSYRCMLPNTQAARDLHASIQRGDISQCSFSFAVVPGGQTWGEDTDNRGKFFAMRELTDVDTYDVSPVTYPAYGDTNVGARSMSDLVPVEIRSSVEEKNMALRATTGIDDSTCNPQDCHAVWSDEMKNAYCEAYKAAYEKARGEGLKGHAATAKAVQGGLMGIHEMATGTVVPGTDQPPSTEADTDKDDRLKTPVVEKRDDDCFEDISSAINVALSTKFPDEDGATGPVGFWSKYYVMKTYPDYVIAAESGTGNYVSIPYTIADDDTVTLGDAQPVEMTFIASDERAMKLAKFRGSRKLDMRYYDASGDAVDENGDLLDESDEDIEDRGEVDPALMAAGHTADGNCEDGGCACQNRFGFHKRTDGVKPELRSGSTRTKHVDGKDLPASKFAYVGDEKKTQTWKLPIHDAKHAEMARSMFSATKGIPDTEKEAVLAKINTACEKFGVTKESNSVDLEKEMRLRVAEHMQRVGPDFPVSL